MPRRVQADGCIVMRRTTVFSHSQSVVVCSSCSAVLCTPTGGKARLTEGMPTLALHQRYQCSSCTILFSLQCGSISGLRSDPCAFPEHVRGADKGIPIIYRFLPFTWAALCC